MKQIMKKLAFAAALFVLSPQAAATAPLSCHFWPYYDQCEIPQTICTQASQSCCSELWANCESFCTDGECFWAGSYGGACWTEEDLCYYECDCVPVN